MHQINVMFKITAVMTPGIKEQLSSSNLQGYCGDQAIGRGEPIHVLFLDQSVYYLGVCRA